MTPEPSKVLAQKLIDAMGATTPRKRKPGRPRGSKTRKPELTA